jgi:hypothetical protein
MEELRKWIDVAARARATCRNVSEFDRLIEHQKQRLEALERTEHERREKDQRLLFGFSDNPDSGTVVGTLPAMPTTGRGRRRTAEEAETDRRLRKEREAEDLDAFLLCYQRATGLALEMEEESENPDFIVRRLGGQKVGIELTAVREGPAETFYRPILTGNQEWDPNDAVDQMCFLIKQKSSKIRNYQTKYNILVLQNEESNFNLMSADGNNIPIEDFASAGFDEIWLADYSEIRKGVHSEIELFGLYPKRLQAVTRRSDYDKKSYR